jgi:predicted phage-related endonuclease
MDCPSSPNAFDIVCSSNDRNLWLEQRRKGIGGSDAPAILGLVGWASPASVQADKWGLIDEPEQAEHLRWGLRLEGAILAGLADEIRVGVEPFGQLIRSTKIPFMQCTPDGLTANGAHRLSGLYVQAKNSILVSDWADGPPERVWVQVQHEMAVTGAPECIVVALLMGNRLVWSRIDRDTAFINKVLIPAEREFWRLTEAREPAPMDASEHTTRALQLIYPDDSGETVPLDGHFLDLDAERAALGEQRKAVESRLREIDNELRAELKEATFGVLPNGVRYSLKTTQRKGYTVEATKFRALRRLKAKAS